MWSMQKDDKRPSSRKVTDDVQGHKESKSKKKGRKLGRKPKPQATIQTNNDALLEELINDDHYVVPENILQAPFLILPDLSSIVVNTIPMQEITPFPASPQKKGRALQRNLRHRVCIQVSGMRQKLSEKRKLESTYQCCAPQYRVVGVPHLSWKNLSKG